MIDSKPAHMFVCQESLNELRGDRSGILDSEFLLVAVLVLLFHIHTVSPRIHDILCVQYLMILKQLRCYDLVRNRSSWSGELCAWL